MSNVSAGVRRYRCKLVQVLPSGEQAVEVMVRHGFTYDGRHYRRGETVAVKPAAVGHLLATQKAWWGKDGNVTGAARATHESVYEVPIRGATSHR
ncbi:MAG TPA: hypothetical protein PKD12_05485 [Nitrospira sp.]|nr:hypothetical protein [Nitrospira sp.]